MGPTPPPGEQGPPALGPAPGTPGPRGPTASSDLEPGPSHPVLPAPSPASARPSPPLPLRVSVSPHPTNQQALQGTEAGDTGGTAGDKRVPYKGQDGPDLSPGTGAGPIPVAEGCLRWGVLSTGVTGRPGWGWAGGGGHRGGSGPHSPNPICLFPLSRRGYLRLGGEDVPKVTGQEGGARAGPEQIPPPAGGGADPAGRGRAESRAEAGSGQEDTTGPAPVARVGSA